MASLRFTPPETNYLLWSIGRAQGRKLGPDGGESVLTKFLAASADYSESIEIELTGPEMNFLLSELGRQWAERFSLPKGHCVLIESRHQEVRDKIDAAWRAEFGR